MATAALRSAIPIIVCGRRVEMMNAVMASLSPECDVVHACLTHTAALHEIPSLLSGTRILPSSGIGTNPQRPESERIIPKAVTFGGGVSVEEIEEIKKACGEKEREKVLWVKLKLEEVLLEGGRPDPKHTAELIKSMLKEGGL